MTAQALKAGFGDDLFDDSPGLKLANSVVLRNEDFATDVADRGHTYGFCNNISAAATADDPDEVTSWHNVRYRTIDTDLEDIMDDNCEVRMPREDGIKQWLENIYTTSRGFELGTFDVSLLTVVWRKQSFNWDALAMGYINDIVSLVHDYTKQVLSKICTDKRISSGVSVVLLDLLAERYRKGIDHARMILAVEREGTPLTANHYFAENLEKW